MFTGLLTSAFIFSPYLSTAEANLDWSITGYGINVVSELHYRDARARGLGFRAIKMLEITDRWVGLIELDYSDGKINAGNSRDSDYDENDRMGEFSRSRADITGDQNRHLDLTLGLKTQWFQFKGHHLSILSGYGDHAFNLRVRNGVQEISRKSFHPLIDYDPCGGEPDCTPYLGPIYGLNTTYAAGFKSFFWGLASEHVFGWGTLGIEYLTHDDIDYQAVADWNLRPSFAHPVSFKHTSKGTGERLTLGYSRQMNENLSFFFHYVLEKNTIGQGKSHNFFSKEESIRRQKKYDTEHPVTDGSQPLNGVNFESVSYNIGFNILF